MTNAAFHIEAVTKGSVSQRVYRYDMNAAAESTHQSRADYALAAMTTMSTLLAARTTTARAVVESAWLSPTRAVLSRCASRRLSGAP
jgi:hypothetical protein